MPFISYPPLFLQRLKIHVAILSCLFLMTLVVRGQHDFKSIATDGSMLFTKKAYSDTVWTITGPTVLDSRFKKWKFDFVLDARQTIVSNTVARLAGIRIGMEYRRVHRFGFGFYNFGDGVNVNALNEISPFVTVANLNLSYNSVFYERVMLFNPKWEVSLTGHLGNGTITGTYTLESGRTINLPTVRVRPIELSTTCYYNLTWWCSIGGGIGYRYMRQTPVEVRPIYNAPVAILRVRIKFGKLTKSIWNHDIKHTY